MSKLVADLHLHSHFSRATSRDLDLEHLAQWAQIKGVQVVATGDIAHPGWLAEIKEKLVSAEESLFQLKPEIANAVATDAPAACQGSVRFLLGGEVSNIYKKGEQVRKIHHLLFMPTLAAVERLQAALEKIGNIRADGRPIFGLDSRNLLEIVLETDPQGYLIPAHIWTPWFAILGSKSGFDSIEACFEELTPHIFALETGLSSDPPMNWRVSFLDRYTLISNSDAHSPPKLAREATVFHTECSYPALFAALKSGDPAAFGGTIEFFPQEGKYHCDGHRKCNIRWEPEETAAHNGRCPVCGQLVTVGVLNRVMALADRAAGERPARTAPFVNLIPLPEILGEVFGVGAGTRQVQQAYLALLGKLGPELTILQDVPLDEIEQAGGALLAEGIRRIRSGEVAIAPGYDGEYGVIKLFEAQERTVSANQMALFENGQKRRSTRPQLNREEQSDAARPSLWDEVAAPVDLSSVRRLAETAGPLLAEPPPGFAANVPTTPSPSVNTLLAGLNAEQQAAVLTVDAPLLIVAGPGTGKTRTLTHRIAYLVKANDVAPDSILAITFTNKAATEMKQRVAALLDDAQCARLTIQTFHAFGAVLLRTHAGVFGLAADFSILSEADRLALIRRMQPTWSEKNCNQALAAISTAKNQLLTPAEIDGAVASDDAAPLREIYRQYEAELRANQTVDFDDLVVLPVRLLSEYPHILWQLRTRFRWISVDEYQDVNFAQYRLLRLLTGGDGEGGANLCAIGDPDQAIYGFRGADPGYFLRFTGDFPHAQVVRLVQNYRSTQSILQAASQVIGINANAERLRIWSEFLDQTKLEIHPAPTDKAEAELVVAQIEQMVGGTSLFSLDSGRATGSDLVSRSFGDFAVLYRTSAQSQPLIDAFERSGIPYQSMGQRPLTDYKDVRDVLAFLHLVRHPQATHYREQVVVSAGKRAASETLAFVAGLPATSLPVTELVEQIHRFAVERLHWQLDEAARDRLAQLRRRAFPFATALGEFLDALTLQTESDLIDPRAARVALMTLHAAKGLEFPVVFIVGCEEGLLPYERPNSPESFAIDVEEERRLFFVGMTRAQQKLILSHARSRFLFGQRMQNPPSRFLSDIEQTLTEIKAMSAAKMGKGKPELAQLSLF
jgi:DNA helicase-2/ATP-dependent DNA helicase PcrA